MIDAIFDIAHEAYVHQQEHDSSEMDQRNWHEWQQLLAETDGLLDPELLYTCVSWLQRDQQLDW